VIGEIAGVCAAATWAVGSLLFARIGKGVSAPAMNLGKCFLAGGLLSLTALALGEWTGALEPRGLGLLAASGFVGLSLGDTAYFAAIQRIGPGRAIVIQSAAPVFATLGAFVWLRELPLPLELAGVALTVAGVGTVASDRAAAGEGAGGSARLGLVFGLIGALGQAVGSVLTRAARSGASPLAGAAIRLVVGGLGLLAVAALLGRAKPIGAELAKDRTWLRVGGASMVGSYCGIWLAQVALMRSSSTAVAATLLALPPLFALPIAHFTGAERIRARSAVGAGATVAGVGLLALARGI